MRDFTNPEDRSITNRLVIWEKAAVLSSDFPLSGVGPDKFGDLYRVAYSPLQMMEESRHPVNTYLYISVSYGFPILFLLLIVIFSVMKLSLNIRKEDNIGVGIFSAFIGWMVAVFFSTNLNIFLYISLILLLILTIILFIRNGNKLQHVNLLIPISAAALICMIIGLAGIYFRRDAPVRPRLERIIKADGTNDFIIFLSDRFNIPVAVIVYSINTNGYCQELEMEPGRLALSGKTVAISQKLDDLAELKSVIATIRKDKVLSTLPLVFVGQGQLLAQQIIIASTMDIPNLRGILAIGAPSKFLTDDGSLEKFISTHKVPLTIIPVENNLLGEKRFTIINKEIARLLNHGN